MKSAVFTVVQNDMTLLEVWIKYYHRYFDDILVFCNTTKEEHYQDLENFKEKYGIQYDLTGMPTIDPGLEVVTLREIQKKLLENHRWVLFCDIDEFIVADPKKYKDLKDLMRKTRKKWVPCEAFDVVKWGDEKQIDYTQSYLVQREFWVKSPSYNKIILSKVPLEWNDGCHQIAGVPSVVSTAFTDTGLYLIHLKHADLYSEGRDLGPMTRPPDNFVMQRREDSRLPIPEEIKRIF